MAEEAASTNGRCGTAAERTVTLDEFKQLEARIAELERRVKTVWNNWWNIQEGW